jgi:hypothetical protein
MYLNSKEKRNDVIKLMYYNHDEEFNEWITIHYKYFEFGELIYKFPDFNDVDIREPRKFDYYMRWFDGCFEYLGVEDIDHY